jgi:tetratricopeptide (TPR) repeat protein
MVPRDSDSVCDSSMPTDPSSSDAAPPVADPAIAEILGLMTRGYTRSAAERAALLLDAQPDNAEAQRLYGVALFRLNEREAALAALRRAVELAPEGPEAAWGYAEALHAAGRSAEAREVLERLLAVRSDDAVALLMLARLCLEAGERERAYDLARGALAADPEVSGGRTMLAALAVARGDFEAAADALLPRRQAGREAAAGADPACLLARSLYAAGRNRELASLPPAARAGQRHNEATLVALAAFRENNLAVAERALAQAAAELPNPQGGGEGTDAAPGQATFATLSGLTRTLLRQRAERPEMYAGEVTQLIGVIGDSHVLSAGHLVVPWRAGKALLLPEMLLDAAPSLLLAEPEELQTAALTAALRAAFDRLPEGATPAVCLGELDLRLTQGLFSKSHALSEAELLARLKQLAAKLAAYVAAEGKVRGQTPILVTPPASNAPLSLVPEEVRRRFDAANKRFVGTLRQAARSLELPLVDLRAATERGGQVQGQLYIDTNHLWPEAWHRAFAQHAVLPEPAAE